jgi:drug/metabolite transporter (DMT)-like permease
VKLQLSRLDALLLLMTVIWGSNYSIIKAALREIPPLGFNALRMILASSLFLAAICGTKGVPRLSRRDWIGLVLLALVGQFIYQLLFMSGLARTSVSNSALILGCTPIFVALMTAALGHERISAARWAGVALSAFTSWSAMAPPSAAPRSAAI